MDACSFPFTPTSPFYKRQYTLSALSDMAAQEGMSELLQDEHAIGGETDLKPPVGDGNISAEVADVLPTVDPSIAVEDFAPQALWQARCVRLNDVAVQEWLIAQAGNDEQPVAASGRCEARRRRHRNRRSR